MRLPNCIVFCLLCRLCSPPLAMTAERPRVSEHDHMPQILIPEGELTMGADDEDAYGRRAEFPPHRVYLDAYWIDQHEVTNAQYARFLNVKTKGNPRTIYGYCDLGNPACRITYDRATSACRVEEGFERHPVCAVSWYGASAYARYVKRRLPTEAEWEKAARGTDGRRYPWGNEWQPGDTNTREVGPGRAVAVGSVESDRSPYGVRDLAGNVREWVQDVWDERYYLSSPSRNPVKEGPLRRCVVRGGAWCLTEWDARVTSRQVLVPSSQRRYMGFRCAQTVPKPLPPAAKVSRDVTFYAPFDGVIHAAAAQGERRAMKAPKHVPFVAGRRGQAVLLGEDAKQRYWIDYDTEANIRLDEGTVAFWIQLRGWKGTDQGFRFLFMLRDETCCKFYIYRFTSDQLLVLAGNGIEGQWGAVAFPTHAWTDGQWIHLAVTWQNRTVALYVDGQPIGRSVVPKDKYFRGLPDVFSLGQTQSWDRPGYVVAQTAFDELVIFSRALTADEIVEERDRQGLP